MKEILLTEKQIVLLVLLYFHAHSKHTDELIMNYNVTIPLK